MRLRQPCMVMSGVVTAADPEHRAYEKFVEEEIFAPLGMSSCSIGMQPERRARLESSDLLAPLYLRGPRAPPWRILPEEKNRRKVEYPCPAGNGRGPAKELAALYASLLPGAPGPLLQAETVQQITAVAREGIYDELQGVDTPWSLGFAVNCILSGRHASPKAFGHGGSQSSWAFADPEHGLAVCCLCNGKPGPDLHYKRVGAVSTAVYEDLGLAKTATAERRFRLPGGCGTF